jgi:hypothetical protein
MYVGDKSMNLSAIALLVLTALPNLKAHATEAAGSFHIQIKSSEKSTFCNAVLLSTRKSERCYAVTARDCLIDPKLITGATTVRSAELGEHRAEFFVTPGDAALLSWKCTGNENGLPSFSVSDNNSQKKIGADTSVKYGKAVTDTTLPSQLYSGQVVGGDSTQTAVRTPGQTLGRNDLGEPLLCRVDDVETLCGIFVSAQNSRFATGDAMNFIRTKLKAN